MYKDKALATIHSFSQPYENDDRRPMKERMPFPSDKEPLEEKKVAPVVVVDPEIHKGFLE
jgi:hypothetical protein